MEERISHNISDDIHFGQPTIFLNCYVHIFSSPGPSGGLTGLMNYLIP